jgi:hypothetical protein
VTGLTYFSSRKVESFGILPNFVLNAVFSRHIYSLLLHLSKTSHGIVAGQQDSNQDFFQVLECAAEGLYQSVLKGAEWKEVGWC